MCKVTKRLVIQLSRDPHCKTIAPCAEEPQVYVKVIFFKLRLFLITLKKKSLQIEMSKIFSNTCQYNMGLYTMYFIVI